MTENSQILQQLRKAKPTLQKEFGLTKIALFGSYARNGRKAESDIDLFIDLSKNISSNFFIIAFHLQGLFHPIKVDIVTQRGIKPAYFESIRKDLIYA